MAWVGFCLLIKWKNFYRGNKRQQCNLIYCLFYIALLRLGYKPDKKEHKMMGKWRVNPAPLQYSSFFVSIATFQWTLPVAHQPQAHWCHPHCSFCKAGQWNPGRRKLSRTHLECLWCPPSILTLICPQLISAFYPSVTSPASGTHRSQHWECSPASVHSYIALTFIIMTFVSRSCKHEISFENQ